MKKLLLALTLILSISLGAQNKDAEKAIKDLEKAQKDASNPKRATNPTTWLKMSDAYSSIYDAPVKTIWLGASQLELKVVLKDQRIISSETKKVNGEDYNVDSYADKDLYYGPDGSLAAWVITKPYMEGDLLKKSMESLDKAVETANGSKNKDIADRLAQLKIRYYNEGMNSYTLGDFKSASANFEVSSLISVNPLINNPDTTMMYYTGLTANMYGDYQRAIKFFELALSYNFDSNGDLFSNLSEAYKNIENPDKAKDVLLAGFTKYPLNQSILVSLINLYLETNDDPNKVLDLIRKAQENEPTNASLYYAEGNVWKKLNNMEKAIESFNKSVEVDPNYVFGSFAVGTTYYDTAVDLQTKAADEMDDKKYEEMVKQLEQYLELAIEPFENAYNVAQDADVKAIVAEYLKNIYFRFREKGENFKAGYDKYNAIFEANRE
ncbi:MAG: tetratricopeptide repeat protein [Bacteroidales bacterium]|jgi:tetratricopeptide (TPR) repeat protein|nr:tetratricopeptide repeat protein [Bacteroidales bacterium]MDD3272447.1 tetratricopeptide repeat protein [Bacteroidales bacterium]MDD4057603.1 tetratricopeptide repeat protein [Bacteroidales bacterium]